MNKKAIMMLLCLFTAPVAHPATIPAAPDARTARDANSQTTAVPAAPVRHFLWRISRGSETLYLVGAIHALNPDDYPLPVEMETAFKRSAALVEEINLTMVDPASVQQEALRMGGYPQGKSLRTELAPAVYQRVAAEAHGLGIDMDRLDRLHPWLGSLAILDMQLTQAGFSFNDGVDHHFADEAQMAYKKTIGLETPRYQLRLLADLPAKIQQELLLESLDDARDFNHEMDALITAWEKGDTAVLEKVIQQEFGNYPLVYKLLIADRNQAWMPHLERLMRKNRPYFVVVGAFHLVGPAGLLARFGKAGYKVEQL